MHVAYDIYMHPANCIPLPRCPDSLHPSRSPNKCCCSDPWCQIPHVSYVDSQNVLKAIFAAVQWVSKWGNESLPLNNYDIDICGLKPTFKDRNYWFSASCPSKEGELQPTLVPLTRRHSNYCNSKNFGSDKFVYSWCPSFCRQFFSSVSWDDINRYLYNITNISLQTVRLMYCRL